MIYTILECTLKARLIHTSYWIHLVTLELHLIYSGFVLNTSVIFWECFGDCTCSFPPFPLDPLFHLLR